ncbi:MAG: hypothetical protein WCK35_10800 [Chloroflexota bacterium]
MITPAMFIDSDKGAKAAWKGFTYQTIYIANRVMLLNDESEFYPERVEDLLVVMYGSPTESIQVKAIADALTISDFSPRNPDSFFRRSLSLRQKNENLKLLVISFGPVGAELNDIALKKPEVIKNVTLKLTSYGYVEADVKWLLAHLEIKKVDLADLKKQIFSELNKIAETMAAPALAFNELTSYVSSLSLNGGKTSRSDWSRKLHSIATDFAAMSGFQREYGRSIRPLFEYKSGLSLEKLNEEYKMGINAHPDHIRNNLDLTRENWIERLKEGFLNYQTVIVRGASGQGKSSLAYRYLIDMYPESSVFLIEQVENKTQAANIVAAINGLSSARETNLIAYIDVAPYQTDWLWILEQLQKTGSKIKLLVTIREEDYRRTVVDKSNTSFDDVEIVFDKSEAAWIYSQQGVTHFRDFEEAWLTFGESGPLMEFIYLLNETSTLKQKLEAQINKIKMTELDSQSWLSVLRLSAYAGRLNINLNLRKTIDVTQCKNYDKMIYLFEKEYLLRETENKTYIEPLHAIRAEIIHSILEDAGLYPEEDLLLNTIQCVDNHSQMLIVHHCYDHVYSLALVEKIAQVRFDKWSNYASAVSGMLWMDIYDLYRIDRDVLFEGDQVLNNAFGFFALPDISGLLGEVDTSVLQKILQENNPKKLDHFNKVIEKLPRKHLTYNFIDKFFELSKNFLPSYLPQKSQEISNLGFVLFWMGIRKQFIAPCFAVNQIIQLIETTETDNILDLTEGMFYQNWDEIYNTVLPVLRSKVCSQFQIVVLDETDTEIDARFIADIFHESDKNINFSNNDRTMAVVGALRKLYPGKQQYATKILGADFMEGIPIFDGEKNIPARNLPNTYITQLNSWFHNLNVYEHRVRTWDEYVKNITDIRSAVIATAQKLSNGIDYLYKKNGNTKKLTDESFLSLLTETRMKLFGNSSLLPKCAVDRFGFVGDDENKNGGKTPEFNVIPNFQVLKTALFRKAFGQFCTNCSNFLEQKDDLILWRVHRSTENKNGRLSTINLIEAISQIKIIQMEFEKLFADLIDQNESERLNKQENESLETLLAVWNFLVETNLQKIDSVEYGQTNLIKRRKRDIEWFFTEKIRGVPDVRSISRPVLQVDGNINLYVTVELEKTDLFLRTAYKEFKISFPKAEHLTAESLHILNFVNHMIVCPSIGSNRILAAVNVEVRNFIIGDEEKLIKYITSYEPDIYIKNHFILPTEGDGLFHWNLFRSHVIVLKLVLSHSEKTINSLFSMPSETMVEDKVFDRWCKDGVEMLSKITNQLSTDLQALDKLLQDADAKKYLGVLTQTLNNLEDGKYVFIKSPDKSYFWGLLQEFNDSLANLYPSVL